MRENSSSSKHSYCSKLLLLLLSYLKKWQLPTAIFFLLAYSFPKNISTGILNLPWLIFTTTAFLSYFIFLAKKKRTAPGLKIGICIAAFFLVIGASWAVFDRFGIRPLNFDPEIVFLTVAHFHYAGFVLPIVSTLTTEKIKNKFGIFTAYGIISGVILVAIGIINTHIGGTPKVETFAAWWMATFAIFLAAQHIHLALHKNYPPRVILFWSLAGVSLFAGMILAGLYGMRHIWAAPELDIAWMRALHGSTNVFGFCLLSVLGWRELILKDS